MRCSAGRCLRPGKAAVKLLVHQLQVDAEVAGAAVEQGPVLHAPAVECAANVVVAGPTSVSGALASVRPHTMPARRR